MWQAFEIFLNNGKSYFFNFYKIDKCQNAFAIFKVKENLKRKSKKRINLIFLLLKTVAIISKK